MISSLVTDPQALPAAAEPERARLGLERWREAVSNHSDSATRRYARALSEDRAGNALLQAIFGNSPFLTACLLKDLNFTRLVITDGVDAAYRLALTSVTAPDVPPRSLDELMSRLRLARMRVALTVALADICGVWGLKTVTTALSRFADACLNACVGHLLPEAATQGAFSLRHPDEPERGSGLVLLGVGKLGASELNYSSDIDLIVLYDGERIETQDPDGLQRTFVRLTRRLVRALEERTADGYVFRTDLRLRPDPGATPVCMSVVAAETYYESLGQNWERAAMIKARPAAGDYAAGVSFLANLRPFIWRKHLDFAAIQDIHSIKRQIHAHKGGGTIAIEGHNIKLGRGGIREIEFFAQTQQLIWGGREPAVRAPGTVDALRALSAAGRLRPHVAERMVVAYEFLRRLEHHLQMIDDRQTHSLPAEEAGVAAVAAFMGYRDPATFRQDLHGHLRTVELHYAELFEESPSLGGPGSLVFTGGEHDPDTIATLRDMGFSAPEIVSSTVRGWHHGRHRAMRSTRAREILTELMPALLAALAKTANPDQAFSRLDAFLERLPAGVQLFSLFHSNPSLLELVAEIMGGAPRLAAWLSRNPLLLDRVLEPSFYERLPDTRTMAAELSAKLDQARDMEDVLDLSRRWTNEAKFQVGAHILRNLADLDEAGRALSNIADTVIRTLLPRLEEEFVDRHGYCAGDGFGVVALGKLGGRELTATSDLDLVFLYDAPADAPQSDGARPLSLAHYYQRFGQRVIAALTALTGEGRLFDVDLRLRPSGNAGPLAVSLDAFTRYQSEEAWTWEHLALTRARVVEAAPPLADRIERAISHALCLERDSEELLLAVAEMRERIDREHHTENPWRVKHCRGGLIDCEFIAQYLELRHAHDHHDVLSASTVTAYERLAGRGLLSGDVATELIEATRFWRRLQGMLRLAFVGEATGETLPPALQRALAQAGDAVDFANLSAKVKEVAARTRAHFEAIIDIPAARIRGSADQPGEGLP